MADQPIKNEESLGYIIIRTAMWIRKVMNQSIEEAGLDTTIEEFRILNQLAVDGPLPAGVIAEKSVKDKSTVTRFVNRLADKGLVTRTRDPSDRRVYHIELTPEGRRINDLLREPANKTSSIASEGMPDEEIAQALDVMRTMFDNLDASLTTRDLGDH